MKIKVSLTVGEITASMSYDEGEQPVLLGDSAPAPLERAMDAADKLFEKCSEAVASEMPALMP